VRVECALRDRHVPPPGQFAVANAIDEATGAELELDVQPYGHREYRGLDAVRSRAFAATHAHIDRVLSRASAEKENP